MRQGVELLVQIGIEIFLVGVGMAVVEVVMVGDPLVLDDAPELQAELDGAQRQAAAFLFQRIGDDVFDLTGGLVSKVW